MIPDSVISALRPLWFRGKGRLLRALGPASGVREARIHGYEMRLELESSLQREIYLGVFEPRETAELRQRLGHGMTFVDGGANVGYFTALASRLVGPTGRVLAIEPSPRLFGAVDGLIRRNSIAQARALSVALGAADGTATLFEPPEAEYRAGAPPTMNAFAGGREAPVRVRSLDSLLDEHGIARVDCWKLDIEGFELEALRGARRAFEAGRIRSVLIELNDYWLRQAGATPKAVVSFLNEAGLSSAFRLDELRPGIITTELFQL